jgi:hypothetical protein
MRNRSRGLAWLTFLLAGTVLIAGITVPPLALADPKGKPGVTPPGVPPGKPFQALQREIDALNTQLTTVTSEVTTLTSEVATLTSQVAALEALAPKPGLMWINTLDFLQKGTSTLALDTTGPGLDVTGAAAGSDTVQVGLQVPLGFSVTGARVCYVPGALGSFISSVGLLQYAATPATPPSTVVNTAFAASPGVLSCVDTTPAVSVDPSAGGVLYLSLGITFSAAEPVVIRAVGLDLTP